MADIEARVFAAGMPVAALMEKVAGRIAERVKELYSSGDRIGVFVGPGHNGGDALVVARELHFSGYPVIIYCPFEKRKELTDQHARYAASLGMPICSELDSLQSCNVLVDGLFGFGLTRSLEGSIAAAIEQINGWQIPVFSIDLPSGLHTDTGEVLGTAIRADRTLCLGLWKRAFLQDQALEYLGKAELIDFDLPLADIQAVLGVTPSVQRLTPEQAIAHLPLPRPPATHKYQQGHLLLVCGSRQYMGAALLAGQSARASGVGMLSIAVPDSLKPLIVAHIPDALTISCPETDAGAIAHLPEHLDLSKFQAIACGPGLTLGAIHTVQSLLDSPCPLVIDADGLNILSTMGTVETLRSRASPTVLTPHLGEFRRLFPDLAESTKDRISAVQTAARQSETIVLLKGARVAIANADGQVWLNPDSTPALARGGSGDVLTGLMGGLLAQSAQKDIAVESVVQTATWWHAQAGILASRDRTELGVDAATLIQYLIPALQWNPASLKH